MSCYGKLTDHQLFESRLVLAQYWLRWWLFVWCHQAIICNNVGLSSKAFCSIHQKAILQKVPINIIPDMCLEMAFSKLQTHFPGSNKSLGKILRTFCHYCLNLLMTIENRFIGKSTQNITTHKLTATVEYRCNLEIYSNTSIGWCVFQHGPFPQLIVVQRVHLLWADIKMVRLLLLSNERLLLKTSSIGKRCLIHHTQVEISIINSVSYAMPTLFRS